jgi:hypothetical protein
MASLTGRSTKSLAFQLPLAASIAGPLTLLSGILAARSPWCHGWRSRVRRISTSSFARNNECTSSYLIGIRRKCLRHNCNFRRGSQKVWFSTYASHPRFGNPRPKSANYEFLSRGTTPILIFSHLSLYHGIRRLYRLFSESEAQNAPRCKTTRMR